jgi:hypothetical protein
VQPCFRQVARRIRIPLEPAIVPLISDDEALRIRKLVAHRRDRSGSPVIDDGRCFGSASAAAFRMYDVENACAGSDYTTRRRKARPFLLRGAAHGASTGDAEASTLSKGERTMKYILMMHAPRGSGDYQVTDWSPADLKAHIGFMHTLNEELRSAGELVGAEGLAAPGEAKLVRAGQDGVPITDGPFAETKEFLAGFWIIEVDGPERAYEVAAKASAAPGPGGVPLNMPIEVRQVMSAPPVDV